MNKITVYRGLTIQEEIMLKKYGLLSFGEQCYRPNTFDYKKSPIRKHFFIDKETAIWYCSLNSQKLYAFELPYSLLKDNMGIGLYSDIDEPLYTYEVAIPYNELKTYLDDDYNKILAMNLNMDYSTLKRLNSTYRYLKTNNRLKYYEVKYEKNYNPSDGMIKAKALYNTYKNIPESISKIMAKTLLNNSQ